MVAFNPIIFYVLYSEKIACCNEKIVLGLMPFDVAKTQTILLTSVMVSR